MRVYVKPFVRWIWLGGLFMMFGGFVAATDQRFRTLPERADSKLAPSPPNPPLEGEGLTARIGEGTA